MCGGSSVVITEVAPHSWGIIDDSGHDMDGRVADLLSQLPLSTRVLFACFKLVYYFFEFYGNLPKPLKHGFLFFAKFKTFLLERLTATPDGIRLAAFFLLPRQAERLQALGGFHEEGASGGINSDSPDTTLNHEEHPLSGDKEDSTS